MSKGNLKNISRCKICGTLKPNTIECSYNNCEIVEKKYNKICVVENISDQWAIESSSIFQGYINKNVYSTRKL